MTTENIKISDLTPYERNARHHEPVDIDAIAKSIEAFGFRDPVGVWGPKNVIVEGHGRVMAAKQLGMTEVPCIRLDDLTDEQRRAYGLAHNKTAELSTWDAELLPLEVQDLPTYDMTAFGFSDTHKTATASAEAVDHDSLAERFIVPPFSVLDTRQGYWMERKKQWLALGIRSNDGRDKGLTYSISDKYDYMAKNYDTETSLFDPVLTELMYRWFCTMGGAHLRLLRRRVSARRGRCRFRL
jgi:hypothetical protein